MIKGLILGIKELKQHKEVAIIGLLLGWGIYQFTGMLLDKVGPEAFGSSIRRDLHQEVMAAELRSKEYADMKYAPVKETVDRIDRNVEDIRNTILKIYQDERVGGKILDDNKHVN